MAIKRLKIKLDNDNLLTCQNFIRRYNSSLNAYTVKKIPGTSPYNQTKLDNKVTWTTRYYGRNPDGTFVKKMFCYLGDSIYMGNDVTGELTSVKDSLNTLGNPEDLVVQVAGNSRMYVFNGYDTPIYYEGDDGGDFQESSLNYKLVQAVMKDGRMFSFERNSSTLLFTAPRNPEDIDTDGGAIIVGNSKDSFIRRLVILGDYLYVFKNDSIWRLSGNSKATYAIFEVVPHTGLLAQKALYPVGGAVVFVSQQDKQVYEFNGTWNTIANTGPTLSVNLANMIDITSTDTMCCIWDRINNLFRLSFKAKQADEAYNNYEIIAPTDDASKRLWKWSTTYGARISCYSLWDRQGDNTLVTGRSDTGRIMYHNRGQNWDDLPISVVLRIEDLIGKDGYNSLWNTIMLKGVPSTGDISFRTYLNSRYTGEGTSSQQTLADLGEINNDTFIPLKAQAKFNAWIPLLTGYNYGESLSIEFTDSTLGKEIELQDIILQYIEKSLIRNSLTG